MKIFIKRFFILLSLLLSAMVAFAAESVTFITNTNRMVRVGEAFRVEFKLNSKPDDDSFKAPSFEGFDVIAGPSVYRGQSVQYVNGTMTQTYEFTYTYVLLPQSEGVKTIGEASIMVDGKSYRTRPVPVEVVNEQPGSGNSANSSEQGVASQQRTNSEQKTISGDDILLSINLSRSSVYKGEPILASVNLYYRVPVVGVNNMKSPSFNGFWAQELSGSNQQPRRETINGKVYDCSVLMQYLLYPQQSGNLTIDAAELEAVAQIVVQNNRSRDPFFGSMPEVHNVNRKVRSPRVTISVKELPAGAPESFAGAVGRFSLSETPPTTQFAANSAGTYTIRIAGSGNLRFVQAPKLSLPNSFELYDVKSTEQINSSAGGASGYRQFEYPFIARAEGEYDIAPIEFSYFDPSKAQYVTLKTQPLHLSITPDESGSSSSDGIKIVKGLQKEDVKMLGEDIRFIKSGRHHLKSISSPFMLSPLYFAVLCAILLFFVALYFILRKKIRESHNATLIKGKRANKVALQRFHNAKRAMMEQNRYAFYEEMSRALWGYMSDKLNIPVSSLTKENVREELHKRGVGYDESKAFSSIITRCEEAQYSPMSSTQMSDIYSAGVEFISQMESIIKRGK